MKEVTAKDVWNKAISLLARREYSRYELTQKLAAIGADCDLNNVLDELEEAGYQSDRRYVESFVRMRVGQGHGLNRIRFDLGRKGVSNELLRACLDELQIDWFELAADLYQRKYPEPLAKGDYKGRSKRLRYMSQRGFSMDEINYAAQCETE